MPQAMEIWNAAAAEAAMDVTLLAQNPVGPMGADFGKASPIGLLVIVLLLVVILFFRNGLFGHKEVTWSSIGRRLSDLAGHKAKREVSAGE